MTNQDCRSALAGLAHLLLRGRGAGAQVPLAAGAGRKQAGGRSCFLSLELKGILSAFPRFDSRGSGLRAHTLPRRAGSQAAAPRGDLMRGGQR